jgi:anti-anti-sigma factor
MVPINQQILEQPPSRREAHSKFVVINVEQKDDVCIFRVEGRFVTGVDPEYLRAKKDEIKGRNCGKVLADFRGVPQLGSTGLSFIVGLYTSVTRDGGGRLVLVGLHPRVREVLDVTRLSTVIPLAADITSGLAALRGKSASESSS